MKGFIDDVNQKSGDYGSLPFWSWNDRLNEDELRRQMRVMKDIGMNGFFMHARGGLETEYLSDEWYSCINACIDEAKKLGMEKVPVIHLDHLTDEQRRAYALAHNRTAELSEWDEIVKNLELEGIKDIDMSLFGFGTGDDTLWSRTTTTSPRRRNRTQSPATCISSGGIGSIAVTPLRSETCSD
jgi:hypothetical protein